MDRGLPLCRRASSMPRRARHLPNRLCGTASVHARRQTGRRRGYRGYGSTVLSGYRRTAPTELPHSLWHVAVLARPGTFEGRVDAYGPYHHAARARVSRGAEVADETVAALLPCVRSITPASGISSCCSSPPSRTTVEGSSARRSRGCERSRPGPDCCVRPGRHC